MWCAGWLLLLAVVAREGRSAHAGATKSRLLELLKDRYELVEHTRPAQQERDPPPRGAGAGGDRSLASHIGLNDGAHYADSDEVHLTAYR